MLKTNLKKYYLSERGNLNCRRCAVLKFCNSDRWHSSGRKNSEEIIGRILHFSAGENIYTHGDLFHSIYIVCDGMIKTETETIEGRLQVTGFYTSGECFGLEGLGSECFPGSAIACNESQVYEIKYDVLVAKCNSSESMLTEFYSILGKRIRSDSYIWKTIRNESAYYRTLYFLCDLYQRQTTEYSCTEYVEITMEKKDISSYLGMNPSSLSRELKNLESEKLIRRITPYRIYIHKDALKIIGKIL